MEAATNVKGRSRESLYSSSIREIEGIVVRFINDDGNIEEHAIDVVEAHNRTAQGLMDLLTSSLAGLGIPLDGVVSQCYDGASVMSGQRGGLQKLLSVKCEQPFIHCFCHLVVMEIINIIPIVSEHYALVNSL